MTGAIALLLQQNNDYTFNNILEIIDQSNTSQGYLDVFEALNINEDPTGIEDDISIESGPDFFSPDDNVTYAARFHDIPPVSHMYNWNWKIDLYHADGIYNYISGSTTGWNYTEWKIIAPSLPSNYEWNRDLNGNISAIVTVYGWDSDNFYQEDEKYIGVVYGPSKPIIYNYYPGGATISLYYLASGATSYKIFYDVDSGHPYSGTDAIEGDSPINVGSVNSFKLTGLSIGVPYYLSVKGYNSEGESVYAEEIVVTPITTSGTLPTDEVWYGRIEITGSVTVPTGISLNILPGTIITFQNNTSLVVNGVLNATGNVLNKIIFSNSEPAGIWGNIIFDGNEASSSVLDNVEINYSSGVHCINDANVIIKNSIIDHCTQGIYIYNSEPQILNNQIIEPTQNGIYGEASGKQPLIQGNVITRTSSKSYQGIWFTNYTEPFITNNDVSGFYHAVYLGGGCQSIFMDDNLVTLDPNNRLKDSRYGLTTGWGSDTYAGYGTFGSKNSIYNNSSWDVYSYQQSTVWAQYNYWGNGDAHGFADATSELHTEYYLGDDPWEGTSAPISNQGGLKDLTNFNPALGSDPTSDPNSKPDDFMAGLILERDGKINEAVLHYKQMVIRNSFIRSTLTSLARITNRYDRNDLFNYFEQLVTDRAELKSILLRLLAAMHLNGGNYNETLNIYDEIVTEYGESYEGVSARLDKLFAVLNYGKNIRLASHLLVELESLRITDEELLTRLEFANHLFNGSASLNKGTESENNNTNNDKLPNEFALHNNYPNPFNPTTTIDYSIKHDGLVSLKVYDVLGNEIVSLVNENQIAGNYSVQFDASSLPSGIYIYRLTSGQFTASKKLILLK